MSDFLLELSKNPQARRFIDSLGLPISLPEELRRARGAWEERPLEGTTVVVYSADTGELLPVLASTVIPAGANVLLADGARSLSAFKGPAEAFARKAEVVPVGEPPEGVRPRAVIVDATGFSAPSSLRAL